MAFFPQQQPMMPQQRPMPQQMPQQRPMPQQMPQQRPMPQQMMPIQNRMPMRASQQQFAPPMGAAPLPNPTAAPPMLQPAGMSQIGPQQGMGQLPKNIQQMLTQQQAESNRLNSLTNTPDPALAAYQNQANQVQLTGQAANLYNQLGQLAPSMLQGLDKNAIAANPAALQPMIQAAQSYNQMMQTPQGQQLLNNLPAGIDKYAVAANPQAYMQQQAAMQAQQSMPPSPQGMGQYNLTSAAAANPAIQQLLARNPAPLPAGYMPGQEFQSQSSLQQSMPLQQPAIAQNLQAQQAYMQQQASMQSPQQAQAQGLTAQLGTPPSMQQGLGQLTQKYAEGGQVQMPDPNAWRPPMSMLSTSGPPQGMMPPPQGMPSPMVTAQTQMPFQQGMPNPMVTAQTSMPVQPAVSTGMTASMVPPAQRFAYGGYAQGGKTHHDAAHLPIDQYLSQMIDKNPQASQTFNQLSDQLGDMPLEAINEFIRLIRMAMQNPQRYPEIRQAAIQDQMVDPEDMPEQYDEQLMQVMLSTLIGLRNAQTNKRKVKKAKGGLAAAAEELQKRGRRGDTILAHINPQEAAMLRAHGGAGTINPQTGLVEYLTWKSLWKDIKNTAKIVAPIALSFMVPAAAGWLASSAWGSAAITGLGLQAGSIGAAALSGAVAGAGLGAAGAAISGQNIGKGALIGGVLGGASQGLGQWAKSSAAADATKAGVKGETIGATSSTASTSAPQTIADLDGTTKLPSATGAGAAPGGGSTLGLEKFSSEPIDISTASTSPLKTAAMSQGDILKLQPVGAQGASSGLNLPTFNAQPVTIAPSTAALEATKSLGTKAIEMGATAADKLQKFGTPALTAMASAPSAEIPQDIAKGMSEDQKAYFAKPTMQWDWDAIREAATAETNGDVNAFMNAHMQDIMAGRYNKQAAQTTNKARGGMAFAGGGALSKVAYLAQGSGSGRADTIDAKLSDGEYVIDAETVALLGDGSTKEGARRLDMMRQQLRQQKGKMLSKGKFSTAAKSPLAYLKGVK